MILKIRFGKWRLTITLAPVIDVIGVNSLLPDGNHILMWDFDDFPLNSTISSLEYVQKEYALPNIYILNTGKKDSYIAYCFRRIPWKGAVEIVARTPGVCQNFFKWGVFRKRFTLRVGAKCGRIPKLVCVIPGISKENAYVPELRSWVRYETLSDAYKAYYLRVGED